ncbi:MAG: dihydrolipoyl dehydrogenase [Solirubrobacterales bacterium]
MPASETRQLIVLGAGPGGYAAAFTAADLGLKVTLIDREALPGGVCLYRGCIPAKALLHVAKMIGDAARAGEWGVEFAKPRIDLDKMRAWKDGIIAKLTQGLGLLTKQKKIEYIQGEATFLDSNRIRANRKNGSTDEISFERCILASGARSAWLHSIPRDSRLVMDSEGSLDLENVPPRMLVVGGGYIGLEQADAYAGLGSRVSVVEALPQIMSWGDPELVAILHKRLEKRFESIQVNTRVAEVREQQGGMWVRFEGPDGQSTEATYDKLLVAVGRRPNSDNIGLENTKVEVDVKGSVQIDRQCRTSDPSLLAIGDVTPGPQLAHKANHQGIAAAEVAAGREAAFEPRTVPFVEYTDPELAECGLSEQQARSQGIPHKIVRFPWQASGRAATLGDNMGLTKLVVDPQSERILGVGVVGVNAGDLISEATLAIEMGATTVDVAMTIHPHPTLSETIMEAAARSLHRSIHIGPPRE